MQVSRKIQWWIIGGGYVAITAFAAQLLYARHENMLHDPTIASSGMYAFGDALTVIFLSFLYFVPTGFVLRLLSENVQLYAVYSYVLLLISITAPIALFVLVMNWMVKGHMLEGPALVRLAVSPLMLIVMGVSRWVARSDSAKRCSNFAFLAEALSLGALFAIFVAMLFVR